MKALMTAHGIQAGNQNPSRSEPIVKINLDAGRIDSSAAMCVLHSGNA